MPISVCAGRVSSTEESAKSHDFNPHNIDRFPSRIFSIVRINMLDIIKLKGETEADTYVTATTYLHLFQLTLYHVIMF